MKTPMLRHCTGTILCVNYDILNDCKETLVLNTRLLQTDVLLTGLRSDDVITEESNVRVIAINFTLSTFMNTPTDVSRGSAIGHTG
jgi:hypothetical protein